ncbi:unnamed protein product, partial [Discosporangium mesarthrocarpum]
NHDVTVDTSSDPVVSVTDVHTTLAGGTYGVGQEIPITVVFSAPLLLNGTDPALGLGSGVGGTTVFSAVLTNATSNATSSTLVFIYTVQRGDNATRLRYTGTEALVPNSGGGAGSITDLHGRDVDTTLPLPGTNASLSGKTLIAVNTEPPYITGIGSRLEEGEYGVGQVREV